MKKMIIAIVAAGIAVTLITSGCGSKPEPFIEEPPVEAEKPAEETKPVELPKEAEIEESVPVIISLRNINFDFDKSDLRSDAREILAEHARVLEKSQNVTVLIEGHCDERGTIEYNLALGEKRANAVKNYFIDYGIQPNRLSTISYGKERPLDSRSNEDAWAINRRAAFKVTQ